MTKAQKTSGFTFAGAALVAIGAAGLWSATTVSAADAKKSDSGGWFSKSSAEPAAKPAATGTAPVAVPAAAAGAAPQAEIQTMDQLSKAGVKSCLQIAKAVGQATMFGTEYAAASTWNSKQPDNRFSVSMIGQKLAPNAGATNGISGVFSSPTANGKCDAAALQIIPTQDACSKIQTQVLEKGKLLGDLAGIPILQNAANAQVMLIPAASNSCVVVALSTAYTE
jgi:hypothetical protein